MVFPTSEITPRRPVTSAGTNDRDLIRARIAAGVDDVNAITDDVFFARHPERQRARLASSERALIAEWLDIRDRLVRPALAQATPTAPSTPTSLDPSTSAIALGTLVCNIPGRTPFTYRFTRDDLETTARFLVGEAGGRDNAENRGTLWAMLNRYAFFRNQVPGWGSFGHFLKQYSQTLQPFIKHWVSVKDFCAKCNSSYDNPECKFRPTRTEKYPGTNVPMGQLKSFLELQAKSWSQLPESARKLAIGILTGAIPNSIGNATDVADTKVYFQRAFGRVPSRAEWEKYTREWAEGKGWAWRPAEVAYDQFGHNALFVTTKAKAFPAGATRIVPPGGATAPIPTPPPTPKPTTTSPTPTPTNGTPTPTSGTSIYDGKTPAPGTAETRRSYPTNPPLRSDPSRRSAALYDAVLNQFAADVNPRYAHRNGSTFCNIFVWDVTRAMGAEVPHWIDSSGNPTPHNKGNELNANAVNDWLHRHGARFGWRQVTLAQGVDHANEGRPTVASWKNAGGIGHIAMIRPGIATTNEGPWMAQAGAKNRNYIRMYSVWKKTSKVEIWVHD